MHAARRRRQGEAVDVVIVGAGPAGLSAALILGRCLRRVLVLDTHQPRNAASRALHGFLTRDGIHPLKLRRIALEQLAAYETVRVERAKVTRARQRDDGFDVTLENGTRIGCRKLLLATGVVDELPEVAGLRALYGRSVFHCPYCDGWEHRGQAIAVYGRGTKGMGLALELTRWSDDVVLCTDGPARLSADQLHRLARHGIGVRQERLARLAAVGGQLDRLIFESGAPLPRQALFFSTGQRQASDLADQLGCRFTRNGAVRTGEYETTGIPGLYVAGDASRMVQLAIIAAAEGAQAAFAINTALSKEDLT
jgi:thioredoxin reductase